MSLPVPTKLPEQVTKNKGKDGNSVRGSFITFQQRWKHFLQTVFPSVWLLSYLSTVCVHRTALCCLLVFVAPPPHCRRPHTGLQLRHRSSAQVMQCRCSYCCFPTAPWCSCGYCQNCASTPAENYRPSCRAWHPKDSKRLETNVYDIFHSKIETENSMIITY